MSHRIGRVFPQSPAVIVGPGHGTQVSPGRWRVTFSPPPASTGTKFLMPHFTGAVFGAGDQIEIPRGYDTDRFDAANGLSFWSRPIKGNSVDIFFVDGGSGTGQASLSEFGRGEGLQLGGANASAGGNANGNFAMIDSPYAGTDVFQLGWCVPVRRVAKLGKRGQIGSKCFDARHSAQRGDADRCPCGRCVHVLGNPDRA